MKHVPIQIRKDPEQGALEVLQPHERRIPEEGILQQGPLELPAFIRGVLYRGEGIFMEAQPFERIQDIENTKKEGRLVPYDDRTDSCGSLILLQLVEGGYLALLPVVTSEFFVQLQPEGDAFHYKAVTYGTAEVEGELLLFLQAQAGEMYAAIADVVAHAMQVNMMPGLRLRTRKTLPEMLNYVGWCSWTTYKKHISADLLKQAVKVLNACALPIRWLLVDDGHMVGEKARIIQWEPDPEKFPQGLQDITKLKTEDGIRWMGLWWAMGGLNRGVSSEHRMSDLENHLARPDKEMEFPRRLPKHGLEHARKFFQAMMNASAGADFDFVKIDFQNEFVRGYVEGFTLENGVQTTFQNYQALHEQLEAKGLGLINCFGCHPLNAMNSRNSCVTRLGQDYSHKQNQDKHISAQCLRNLPLMGQWFWGDFDMFSVGQGQEGGALGTEVMGLIRALSGGPVYIDDNIDTLDPDALERLSPVCMSDGRLLRPETPAVLLPESLYSRPETTVQKVVAPLQNGAVAYAAFNFSEDRELTTQLSLDDLQFADGLKQPYPGLRELPVQGVVVYDWKQKCLVDLSKPVSCTLQPNEYLLYHVVPLRQNVAVIGRTDKFLSPLAVQDVDVTAHEIKMSLLEPGPIAVFCREGPLRSHETELAESGEGLWHIPRSTSGELVLNRAP